MCASERPDTTIYCFLSGAETLESVELGWTLDLTSATSLMVVYGDEYRKAGIISNSKYSVNFSDEFDFHMTELACYFQLTMDNAGTHVR